MNESNLNSVRYVECRVECNLASFPRESLEAYHTFDSYYKQCIMPFYAATYLRSYVQINMPRKVRIKHSMRICIFGTRRKLLIAEIQK